eukprot:gene22570-29700_t
MIDAAYSVNESTWQLVTFFSALPVMHKYNMTALKEHAAKLVITEKDWAQGKKKMKHTVGAWLWLLHELQLVMNLKMHRAFENLMHGLSRGRLAGIGREVTAAAIPKQQVTNIEMVMAEFKVCGMEDVLRKCPRRQELTH